MRGLFRHRKLLSAQMDYVEIGECSAVMDEAKRPEKMSD
jgi:hypothetical protein